MKMQVTVEFKDLRNACREEQRWFLDTYGGEVILTKENLASTEAWRVEWLADNVFSCGDVFRQRKREYLYLIDHESSYENGKCGGCVVEGILNSELLLSIIEFREFNKTEFFSRLRAHEVKAALGPEIQRKKNQKRKNPI